jgi:predicted thioesterase
VVSEASQPGRRWTAPAERVPTASLEVGHERSDEFTVADRLLTDVGGSIGVAVLSTPGMVAMMERNAARLVLAHLPEGQASVGFEICIRHVAAALEGARCTVHARVTEIVDSRKLRFAVEVREHPPGEPAVGEQASGDGPQGGDRGRLIGVGTHERRVINVAQHARAAGG